MPYGVIDEGKNPLNALIEPLEPGQIDTHGFALVPDTLGSMAGQLPHGEVGAGALESATFVIPNLGNLRRIGQIKGRKDLKVWGKQTVYALARCLEDLHGKDMRQGREENAALAVARLTVGDVLFLSYAWQHHKKPNGMSLKNQGCGTCGEVYPEITMDLGELDVMRRPLPSDLATLEALPGEGEQELVARRAALEASLAHAPRVRVGLRHGFHMPGGGKVSTVLLRSPSWLDTFWRMSNDGWQNGDLMKAWTIKGAIVGTDAPHEGVRPSVTMREVDQLWEEDVNLIEEAVGRIVATPQLQLQLPPCPACGVDSLMRLGWMDQDFFGS